MGTSFFAQTLLYTFAAFGVLMFCREILRALLGEKNEQEPGQAVLVIPTQQEMNLYRLLRAAGLARQRFLPELRVRLVGPLSPEQRAMLKEYGLIEDDESDGEQPRNP